MENMLKDLISEVKERYIKTKQTPESTEYRSLQSHLENMDVSIRETLQELFRREAQEIVRKLEQNKELTSNELSTMELLMVGDADYYVKLENNFDDWMKELDRLIIEISNYQNQPPDVNTFCVLRALLRDAILLLTNISFYCEERERVARYRESIKNGINRDIAKSLALAIKSKLESRYT